MNYQAIVLLNLFGIILLGFLAISRFMTRQRRRLGDEFVILVNSDKEEDVFAIEDQVSIMAKTFNEGTSEPYRLSFSMGHAKYVRGEAQDDFLRRMDLAMYEDKEKMHRLMDSEDGAEVALK